MGMIILNSIGPKGEELAMKAGKVTEIPVGWDAGLDSATFDSDAYGEAELEGIVFDALGGLDPEWREHLALAE
ncbi:MAG: hypothetical protein ACR2G3_01700 [Solirubrobacterales bacterium]